VLILCELRGTLATVDCRAYGPDGWPRFIVIVQCKGLVTITHRTTDSSGDGVEMYVLPEDHDCDPDPITMRLFSESMLLSRTTRDSILSHIHGLDPRVALVKSIVDVAQKVDGLRRIIVDGLLSSGRTTLFPTGRRVDDPTLSLHELFACVRSLDGGYHRSAHTDSGAAAEEDTARVLHVVKGLREMGDEPQGRQRCVQCGAVSIDLGRRADCHSHSHCHSRSARSPGFRDERGPDYYRRCLAYKQIRVYSAVVDIAETSTLRGRGRR